ncbi:hypothetical protein KDA11_06880, partial [Candidatus Saccharibacteria bacterium]|nr:hypothetical protein [Candidatus Saccharibacteria bacterium]
MFTLIIVPVTPVSASSSITINTPTNGQRFTGNDFVISGTTSSNATVLIQKDDQLLARLISDEDGAWSTTISDLPDGENAITAKVIQSTGFAYFASATSLSSININQLRFNDRSLNTTPGFPFTSPFGLALLPSPTQDLFYSFPGVFNPSSVPSLIDVRTPASPQQSTVSGYPTPVAPAKGDFTADGLKYFSPNQQDNSFSVVDVATNVHIQKISLSHNPIYIQRGPNGNMYISTEGGDILIVDPQNYQIIETISGTCSGYIAGITFPGQYTSHQNYYALCVTTTNGELKKFKLSDNELIGTYDIGSRAMTAVLNIDGSKLFITSSALDPEATEVDKVRVFDTNNNTITDSIQLHGGAVGVLSSPDYQSLYIATPAG